MTDDRSANPPPKFPRPAPAHDPSNDDLVARMLHAERAMQRELRFILGELPKLDADPGRKAEVEGVVRPFLEELFWEVHKELLELADLLAAGEFHRSRLKLILQCRNVDEHMESYRQMMIRPDIPDEKPDDPVLKVLTQEAGWKALKAYERFCEAANKLGERLYTLEFGKPPGSPVA